MNFATTPAKGLHPEEGNPWASMTSGPDPDKQILGQGAGGLMSRFVQ